jgi:hypothetical protein
VSRDRYARFRPRIHAAVAEIHRRDGDVPPLVARVLRRAVPNSDRTMAVTHTALVATLGDSPEARLSTGEWYLRFLVWGTCLPMDLGDQAVDELHAASLATDSGSRLRAGAT